MSRKVSLEGHFHPHTENRSQLHYTPRTRASELANGSLKLSSGQGFSENLAPVRGTMKA